MLHRIRQLKKDSKGLSAAGFTIIEVMIVLAIAGLIMAIVFLAIPGLQRNNRNNQRKADASRMAGLISDYSSNNNGKLPANAAAAIGSPTWSIFVDTSVSLVAWAAGSPGTAPAADAAIVLTGAKCGTDSSDAPKKGDSVRQFVIWYGIEGSTTTQCQQV